MQPSESLTARYVERFKCVGGECIASCCSAGWTVSVDRLHYSALAARMGRSPAERAEFERAVVRDGEGDDERLFGRINLDGEGRCTFLGAGGLCSVQGRYGHEALGDVCAQYPRTINMVGPRREVFGDLSCPEMARLCVLADDAMELVDGISDQTHRVASLVEVDGSPYGRYFDDVRATVYRLLSERAYPAAARLTFVAYLGHRTAPFFHADVTTVDEARLGAELDRVCDPAIQQPLAEACRTLRVPGTLAMAFVGEILAQRSQSGSLARLVQEVLRGYGADVGEALELGAVWEAFEARKRRFADLADRVDLYVENYSKNLWMARSYLLSRDLLAHAQDQLVHVAVLRFLLFSHPSLDGIPAEATAEARLVALDAAAVDVVHRFCRGVEHSPGTMKRIQERLVSEGMRDLAHTTMLALV